MIVYRDLTPAELKAKGIEAPKKPAQAVRKRNCTKIAKKAKSPPRAKSEAKERV